MHSHANDTEVRLAQRLQEQFGSLVLDAKEEDLILVAFPGLKRPVHLCQAGTSQPMVRIDVSVAETADWTIPGLSEFLLREAGTYAFGRIERWGDGIVIEHVLFADAQGVELGAVIFDLGSNALRLGQDLSRMGALAVPGDIESAERGQL